MDMYLEFISGLIPSVVMALIMYRYGVSLSKKHPSVDISPLIFAAVTFAFGILGFLIYNSIIHSKIKKEEKTRIEGERNDK